MSAISGRIGLVVQPYNSGTGRTRGVGVSGTRAHVMGPLCPDSVSPHSRPVLLKGDVSHGDSAWPGPLNATILSAIVGDRLFNGQAFIVGVERT
jgi:hypothetical protein